jgi:hypothetical protein
MSGLFGDIPETAVATPYRFTSGGAERRDRGGQDADYYPTPPWATRALLGLLDDQYGPLGRVWEPACGGGHMAEVLREAGHDVLATDLFDHGYVGRDGELTDFLSPKAAALGPVDWVITNPPFKLADQFVQVGLERAGEGVAVLCRLQFLEGVKRSGLHFGGNEVGDGLSILAPFCERVAMVRGRYDPGASTNMAYAWFIYLKDIDHRLAPTVIKPFMPGTRAAMTRPYDAEKYGGAL